MFLKTNTLYISRTTEYIHEIYTLIAFDRFDEMNFSHKIQKRKFARIKFCFGL